MSKACVLVTARVPDPKRAKAALAPFHVSKDGVTTTSVSGKLGMENGALCRPAALPGAAALCWSSVAVGGSGSKPVPQLTALVLHSVSWCLWLLQVLC